MDERRILFSFYGRIAAHVDRDCGLTILGNTKTIHFRITRAQVDRIYAERAGDRRNGVYFVRDDDRPSVI